MTTPSRNWAGNVTYRAPERVAPTSLAELREVVRAHDRVKPAGTGHSFNDAADTDGVQVSLAGMPDDLALDDTGMVSVPGGVTHARVAAFLHEHGRALPNLASLPHISVAGAVQTGTHGSGAGNPALSAQVAAVHLVDAAGDDVTVTPDDADFDAVVVGLGAFGVVHRLDLRTEPAFEIEQRVYEGLGWDVLLPRLSDLLASAYSVSVFTRYDDAGAAQVWVKQRPGVDDATPLLRDLGAREARVPLHMLPGVDADHVTPQLGERGPAFERLPHFRSEFRPGRGDEIQSELFVDAARAVDAVAAVRAVGPQVGRLLHMGEIRAVAQDSAWLSPSGGRDSVAIHFTWQLDVDAVAAVVPEIEAALRPLDARPHWGKVFTSDAADLRRVYPRLEEFAAVVGRWDPAGRFENDFLRRVLGR